jgi:hypothetical protein
MVDPRQGAAKGGGNQSVYNGGGDDGAVEIR